MATNQSLMNQMNQPTEKKPSKAQLMKHTLEQMGPEIANALPKHMDKDRMLRIALTAAQNTPKLFECDRTSFLSAIVQSSQLGLEPNTLLGHSYLIPYGNKVQFQIGYKGILDLCFRSGEYQAIYAHEVYENDSFRYSLGLNKDLHHIPNDSQTGDPVGYYAVYKLKNGGFDFVYWSKDKVTAHKRKFSKSNNGPWKENFDAMAKKSVIIDVLKYAPKSIEVQSAINADNKIIESINIDDNGDAVINDVTPEFDQPDELEFDPAEAINNIEVDEATGEIIEQDQLFTTGVKSKLEKA